MKNVIKKITSLAMAFILLGPGNAITKIVSHETDTTIVASAADVQLKVFSLFQNDGANANNSEFSAKGCGPTSLAMVYRYYRGKYIDPVTLYNEMKKAGEKTDDGSSREGITRRAGEYNIGVKWSYKNVEARDAIKNGNPVIFNLKGDGSTDFAPKGSAGHYVVLSGYRIKNGKEEFFVDNPWKESREKNGKTIKIEKSGWFSVDRIKQVAHPNKNGTAYGICCDLNKKSAQSDVLGLTISFQTSNYRIPKGDRQQIGGLIYCKNNTMTRAEIVIKPSQTNKNKTTTSSTLDLKKDYKFQPTHCISIGEGKLNNNLKFGDLALGKYTMYIKAYNNDKTVLSKQYSLTVY